MIHDTLENAALYEGMHPAFPRAFAWLRAFDPALPEGSHEIDGPELVAIVQRYDTAPAAEKKWETHRVHGDIQFVASGTERIGHAPRRGMTVSRPYDPEKDAEFYTPPASPSMLEAKGGSFAVFFPGDAHQPGVMEGSPSPVLKVVIKFRL